ncbi:hypothetical protein [Oceanobacillus sp. J11TS1]|uniref:hypothetical protein n=1 Tax=Oceanobacillus sp. J11TS1 TaxID=2807191 RepID=UPI001B00BF3A|nr:hypothetical protein [Oceanobacillus sp. J11TS1]GIO25093.1 hypothetical protein J11TS1_36740 [Oceanobacillus sp. J11TS1]
MKVNLKIKEGSTVQTEQHEVEPLNLFQFKDALKVIKEIIDLAQNDESLKGILAELSTEEIQDTEVTPEFIITRLSGAFEVVLINIPDKAFELLSILSGVKKDTLMSQPAEDAFDIYDAVIEVNNIEKLWKRAKKSFSATKSAMSFITKAKKATGQAQA